VQGPKNTGGIITTLPPAPASNINKWQGQYSSNYFILSSNNNDYTVEKMTINGKVTVSLKSLSVDAFSGEVLFEPNNNGLKCKLFFFAY
jgi:hypothetical protein